MLKPHQSNAKQMLTPYRKPRNKHTKTLWTPWHSHVKPCQNNTEPCRNHAETMPKTNRTEDKGQGSRSLPPKGLHPSRGWSTVDHLVTVPYLQIPGYSWSTCRFFESQKEPKLINIFFSETTLTLLVNCWSTCHFKSTSWSTADQRSYFYNMRKLLNSCVTCWERLAHPRRS